MSDNTFHELLLRAKQGCQDASTQLVRDYGDHIIRIIRRKLNRCLSAKLDCEDVAQDVWKSFFRGALEQQTFESPDQLIAYLVRMAQNKSLRSNRHFLDCQKRDVRREQADESTPPAISA